MGIDPHGSKPYGWAVVDGGKLLATGRCGLKELYSLMESYGPDLVAVEDQYLANNYKVSKMLSVSAGKALGAAEYLGFKPETANVAKWKAFFHCTKGKGTHVAAVSLELGVAVEDDDEASAAGIAYFAWDRAGRS